MRSTMPRLHGQLWLGIALGVFTFLLQSSTVHADTHHDQIEQIRDVGSKGQGHEQAIDALAKLSQADATALLPILKGMKGANPIAINWLRGAFESIAARSFGKSGPVPNKMFADFAQDRSHSPRARRIAFKMIRDDAMTAELVPTFLNDPSADLRREAVAYYITVAEKVTDDQNQVDMVRSIYRRALKGAVHDDQVKQIAAALKALGDDVNLQKHFGFLPRWHIIGPFDNKEMKGFDVVYPPEKGIDLSQTCVGQMGDVTWQPISTDDEYGVIDIAMQIENYKGSVMYATTKFVSREDQEVEMRLGTPNAWKAWINGKLIFAREEYHRSTGMDQFRVKVELRKGVNTVLLKVLQNDQEQNWAQRYQFQFRFTDEAGSGIRPDQEQLTLR